MAITFNATIPALQSAITISGNGDGARIKLDVSENEMNEVVRLLSLRGQLLRVTVELDSDASPDV
jgi:hypothetical protein